MAHLPIYLRNLCRAHWIAPGGNPVRGNPHGKAITPRMCVFAALRRPQAFPEVLDGCHLAKARAFEPFFLSCQVSEPRLGHKLTCEGKAVFQEEACAEHRVFCIVAPYRIIR
jgi:hypothetical protein